MTMYFVNFKLAECRTIAKAAFLNKKVKKMKNQGNAKRGSELWNWRIRLLRRPKVLGNKTEITNFG